VDTTRYGASNSITTLKRGCGLKRDGEHRSGGPGKPDVHPEKSG